MAPPSAYAMWWRLTEACSGLTGDFSSVHWFQLPGVSQFAVHDTIYQSYWWQKGNRVLIVADKRLQGQLVRHEMLHALSGPLHRHEYFVDKCGGIVACEGNCLSEAGATPDPPADAPAIDPRDLDVSVDVEPSQISVSADSGWTAITVSARSLPNSPEWVRLTAVAAGASASATFGYTLECLGGCGGSDAYEYVLSDKMGFGAGQTRRYAFDRRLPPGRYAVRGFFNVDTTQLTSFQVLP